MNRAYSFLIVILLILVVELFQWEALPNPSRDLKDNFSTNAVAAPNNDGLDSYFGIGLNPDSRFKNSGVTFSKTNPPDVDPVIILLFGGGLVGLAGLGRMKG